MAEDLPEEVSTIVYLPENDRDASTLLVGNSPRVHICPGTRSHQNFVLLRIPTNQMRVLLARSRVAGLALCEYIKSVKLCLCHSG